MKTKYMIVAKETGISHRSFDDRKSADSYAAEMSDYHQKRPSLTAKSQ